MEAELYKILEYAINNVPYYRDLFDHIELQEAFSNMADKGCNNWEKIPIMSKDICRRAGNKLLSDEYSGQYTSNRVIRRPYEKTA